MADRAGEPRQAVMDLRSAHYYPGHGIGTYTTELFRAMAETAAGRGVAISGAVGKRRLTPGGPLGPLSRPLAGEAFWRLAAQPPALQGDEALWHNPHNGLGVPPPSEVPLVVTVHDLIPLVHPDHARPDYVRAFAAQVPTAVRGARAVIAVSAHTRDDLVRLVGADPAKITVIPESARRACYPIAKPVARTRVERRFGLADPYLLYLGGFAERKNLATLIEAFALAKKRLPPSLRLVVAGAPERTCGQIQAIAHRLGCAAGIVFLGHIAESDLANLYSGAEAFVYPSRYEGFGLPPLEAMACGCPVVCSDATSLPEACGAAATLVNPDDAPAMAEAIARIVLDPAWAAGLRDRGLRRAKEFTWGHAARQTMRVYASALTDNKSTAEGLQ